MKLLWSGLLLAAGAATLAGCNSSEPSRPVAVQTVQARVVESHQQQTALTVRSTGTLHARQSATISAQVVGRIQQILVRQGDVVRAGQTLAVLDDATLKASVDQAQASIKAAENQQAAAQTNAELAASTLARYKQLQAQKSVSPQELDEISRRAEGSSAQVEVARAQVTAAKAQETGARAMLGYTRITAPFAGVVTARMADPGALAAPGVPLLQIDSAGPLELQTTVDESAIASVRLGMKLNVTVDSAPSLDPAGTVSEIVPAADPASHSFLVKVDLPSSPQLRAGMYATAAIPTGSRQATFVPRSAVVLRGSLSCAYILDSNGIAQLRYVTLGAQQGDLVEVLSGISAGDKLVDEPGDRDLAGKRIESAAGVRS
ncbi:efflux RND transporter periplasmic adaptor subunit [Occallatibacter riparius]|uniref:Efflux RND transporter periplasmic adaptor subunit n=1 Tax=Occallatibacter riparius TaxID=1002689 RepID=A0A9J7BKR7_9BACT|nr:efflux RND transporter periplasmic adaptor subunit [Occallatibacter riparius]UWZ83195.1 efflux RND transporter periplasmic adaptor subunit [Occallatibacter riparius]